MRRIIVSVFVSLDGVMQAPGGPAEDTSGGFAYGGWVFHYFDEAAGQIMDELFAQPFDLVLGRKTYDVWAAHWPRATEGDSRDLAEKFNACRKYVATRSADRRFDWQHTVPLRGDAAAQIRKLKDSDGPTLLVQGSSDLLQTLLSARLVDELRVMTFPLLLGSGKRLFGSGVVPAALKLTATKSTPAGVLVATYVPAGEIATGSFALEPDAAR